MTPDPALLAEVRHLDQQRTARWRRDGLAEEISRIVHAFGDEHRRSMVRDLADRVELLERERDELRLTLAAEQGKSEGAPSSRWTWRGGHWQVGPDTDLVARAWPGGRLYMRGRLTHHNHARAAMLAADAALRETEK